MTRIPRVSIGLLFVAAIALGQPPKPPAITWPNRSSTFPPELVKAGENKFVQDCAFCHGRDTGGGESGPDLTRSKVVADDVGDNLIGPIIRNGRNAMPRFTVSDQELAALGAFIHAQKNIAESQTGGRKGVDAKDLATGNIEKGKQYFNGTGKMQFLPLTDRGPCTAWPRAMKG